AGGCLRQSEDIVADGNYPDYLNHAGLAGAKGSTDWESDDRVAEVRAAWSQCMSERGYDYERPLGLYMDLFHTASELNSDWRTAQTISESEAEDHLDAVILVTAQDDAACHERTNLQDVQEDVYWEYM